MSVATVDWHDDLRERGSVIRLRPIVIPVVWIAVVLSLLVHLAALWEWLPKFEPIKVEAPNQVDATSSTPISVQLGSTQAPPPQPTVALAAPVAPRPPVTPPKPAPRVAMNTPRAITVPHSEVPVTPPAPVEPAPPPPLFPPPTAPEATPPPTPVPTPAPPPAGGDLSSYIASRRRARGASEQEGSPNGSPEDDIARRDRIVASNLASVNSRNYGDAPKNSGGVFRILQMGYDDAEFAFFGWNKDINRRANMRIEVRRTGADVDIRHAVVRKMIAIIRQYEVEDFTWESLRLGRNVRLSARQSDNAALEAFLLLEFFDGPLPR